MRGNIFLKFFSSEIRTIFLGKSNSKKNNLKASSVAGNSIIRDASLGGQGYLQGQSYPGLWYFKKTNFDGR